MFASTTMAVRRRMLSVLLPAALLSFGRGPAARAAEPLVAVAQAVPPRRLIQRAHLLGRQPASAPVTAGLILPMRNQDALHTLLRRLYDPKDPLHGKFLSADEFTRRFGPTQADYDAVAGFARAHGLTVQAHPGHTLVGVSGASGAVERAFGVRLNQYRTPQGRLAYANDAAPRLPASVAARLGGIVGLDNLLLARPHIRRAAPADVQEAVRPLGVAAGATGIGTDVPSGGLTPADIKNVYNLAATQYQGEGQSVGICAPGGGYDLGDINAYVTKYGLPTDAGAFINVPLNGYDGTVGPNFDETVLDLDMILALAPRVNHIFVYITPDSSIANTLTTVTRAADADQAQVVSLSYGLEETAPEVADSFNNYQSLFVAQEQVYERMAAQGQSMFVSSGDNGAYTDGASLTVSYNASAPTVTAVGGTTLSVNNVGSTQSPVLSYGSEKAWGDKSEVYSSSKGSGSGGGVSNFWGKPSYQYQTGTSGAVGYGGFFTPAMRDVPDVSLNADPKTGYAIYLNEDTPAFSDSFANHFQIIGGTSAASPLWAAFTALVNEGRALGGAAPTAGVTPGTPARPVGFANTLIYQIGFGQRGSYGSDFHDITTGNNLAYPAQTGYDDATGWGSFNGGSLLADMIAAGGGTATGGGGTTGTSAVLTGTVTFNGAAPVGVSATVRAVSTDGSVSLSTTSDPNTGAYTLSLPTGLTYTVSAAAPGYTGQSIAGVALTSSGVTQNLALTTGAAVHTFASGIQMISAPFDFSGTGLDFAGLFGLTTPLQSAAPELIVWQPVPGAYVYYPAPPADTLRPGSGYWLRVPSGGASLQFPGAAVTGSVTVVLQAGWNQIGDPYAASESLGDISVATDAAGATALPLPEATNLVSSTLYTYPPNNGAYVAESSALQPYLGYWVYARRAVYLTYAPPPPSSPGSGGIP